MSSTREEVIWRVIAVAAVSFALGILSMLALERSMVNDQVYATGLLLILPICALAVVVNTRRILGAIGHLR